MKKIFLLLLSCSLAASAALKPGDEVKPDAITAAHFIKGEAPKEWEKDKLYILECWATWCGPCLDAIPHVNELHKKYQAKGLRVIGMNVWEDDKAAVEAFVKKKGDDMSYPVAFVNDTAFTKDWLEAAGINGIPNAFVVKNGKLLLTTHPSNLEDSTIEDLLAGGEKEAAVMKQMEEANAEEAAAMAEEEKQAQERKERMGNFEEELNDLGQKNDFPGILTLIERTQKENQKLTKADKQQLTYISCMVYAQMKKFDEALKTLDAAVAIDPESPMAEQVEKIKAHIEMMKTKSSEKE